MNSDKYLQNVAYLRMKNINLGYTFQEKFTNKIHLEKLIASEQKVVEESEKPYANANVLLEDLQKTVKNINDLTSKDTFKVLRDKLHK